jgi:transposase-like protein
MKHSVEERCKIVERCLDNEISVAEATRELSVSKSTIQRWITLYEMDGPSALLPAKKRTHYSKELKLAAVADYLNGLGSMIEIGKNMVCGVRRNYRTG